MSYPRYPAYKDSGVEWLGEVPEHWEIIKFRYCFKESAEKIENEVVGDMLSVSGYRGIEIKEYDDENRMRTNDELIGYRIVREGQLVVNTMWLNYAGLGVSCFVGHVSPAYRCYWIAPKINKNYAHHLLRSSVYVGGYTKYLTGIRPNSLQMSRDDLMDFPVTLPSAIEQTRIAIFLDVETKKIDGLVVEQEKLIELLKEKRQEIISNAVTKGLDPNAPMKDSGVEWLGEVPEHWKVQPFKYVIHKIESGTSVNAAGEPALDGEWGVLKTSCVYSGKFDASENKIIDQNELQRASCKLTEGTLIVSRMNTPELVGAAGLVEFAPANIFLPDRLWQVYLSGANVSYSYYWTQSLYYRAQIRVACAGTSSSMQNLGQDQFRSFIFPTPPSEEQAAIALFLSKETTKIDKLLKEAELAIDLLKERRSALISAAVTGKIDVRGIEERGAA